MLRGLTLLLLTLTGTNLNAQVLSGPETVKQYSLAQKRLLLINTAQFTSFISQNNLDRDSVMLIASKVTGLPFLLAYNNMFDGASTTVDELINTGKITEAVRLSHQFDDKEKLPLIMKIAAWYIHKVGTYKRDLDSAFHFINEAMQLSTKTNNKNLYFKCLNLLGEYYRQTGDEKSCRKTYVKLINLSNKQGDQPMMAEAWLNLGTLHNRADSSDKIFLDSSLAIFRRLQFQEREIELLWYISSYHAYYDITSLNSDLLAIHQLQLSITFRHTLFTDYFLSFADVQRARFTDALEHANKAFENMKWSGMEALEGAFCIRVGAAYDLLGKHDEGLAWLNMALAYRNNDNHIYWYKALFWAAPILIDMGRTGEALSLMNKTTSEFPPITLWEKWQVLVTKAHCYEQLNNDKMVDETYRAFIKLLDEYPELDPYGEFSADFRRMFDYYLAKSNLTMVRLFARKVLIKRKGAVTTGTFNNYILYKLDSLEGRFQSALDNYIRYQLYTDSFKGIEQSKAFNELTLKYSTEKKDKDIKLLQKDKELLQKDKQLQGTMLLQERHTRNWVLGAAALLLAIVALLVYNSQLKQRTNKKLKTQQTAIEKQNSALRHLVEEKDWLVKEIHHRVKNNLQTVMSLLGTQSTFLKNDIAIDAINDSQRRIQAMSLIHQRLYQSNKFSAIEMTDYIHELAESLRESFGMDNNIRFDFDIDPVRLNLAYCIPLGLILNEAITNCFKYAFPNNPKGIVYVSLKNTSTNNFLLTIKDDGVGLSPMFNPNESDTMGMELMRGLSDDIGAEFLIDNENGTRIDIGFIYRPDIEMEISTVTAENVYPV